MTATSQTATSLQTPNMDLENEKKTLVEEPTTTQDDGEKQAKMGDLWVNPRFLDMIVIKETNI